MQSTLLDKVALMITDEESKIHEAALRVVHLLSKQRRMIKVRKGVEVAMPKYHQQQYLLNSCNTNSLVEQP